MTTDNKDINIDPNDPQAQLDEFLKKTDLKVEELENYSETR